MEPSRRRALLLFGLAGLAIVGLFAALFLTRDGRTGDDDRALQGEARQGGLTMSLGDPIPEVRVREAKVPGRPIILIDPGHGGNDPGAPGVSGTVREKALTLALAKELADLLQQRGRVRVALTREDDRYLTLEQRAAIARRLGASLFLSIHMDSAPNAAASGATVYSLSDVASSAEAARFAKAENAADGAVTSERDDQVRELLADVALRDQMEESADLASRTIRYLRGNIVPLRPVPHQFAAFHVLRRAEIPAVLVEAGYVSNAADESRLMTAKGREPLVRALAQAVEADAATRAMR